jgi:uncharacterized membrane protein YhaH (DUF805 family)
MTKEHLTANKNYMSIAVVQVFERLSIARVSALTDRIAPVSPLLHIVPSVSVHCMRHNDIEKKVL